MSLTLTVGLETPSNRYSFAEVAKHNKDGDLWIVINNNVYDLSKFANFHPAGRNVLIEYGG